MSEEGIELMKNLIKIVKSDHNWKYTKRIGCGWMV